MVGHVFSAMGLLLIIAGLMIEVDVMGVSSTTILVVMGVLALSVGVFLRQLDRKKLS